MASTTHDYLQILAAQRGAAIVVTTMTAAKVWPLLSDSPWDVNYLPSAMSHASDIALGLALACPDRRVICVNGDGSLAMNLGSLITASQSGVRNLTQLVMVNGTYQLVGGSPVPGHATTDWPALAAATGWPVTAHFQDHQGFSAGVRQLLTASSLAFASLTVCDPADLPMRLPPIHPGAALRALRGATASGPASAGRFKTK